MTDREEYNPGPAMGAHIKRRPTAKDRIQNQETRKDEESWTLIVVRELRHSPEKVWQALTEPAQLRQWAPFDSDRPMSTIGTVKLTTVGTPAAQISETKITRADVPRLLEYNWGGNDLRWQLEPMGSGTRLTLWHNINRRFIAMGAAGWHICFDVLVCLLNGSPIGRIVGPDSMKLSGWRRLTAEYAKQFGVETP